MDLTEWLRAQLDEREAEIRAALAVATNDDLMLLLEWMLADIAAKRRIIDLHPADEHGFCDGCHHVPCPTVRLLALPYADRPGYREGWRP